jgi:hypothetical protein
MIGFGLTVGTRFPAWVPHPGARFCLAYEPLAKWQRSFSAASKVRCPHGLVSLPTAPRRWQRSSPRQAVPSGIPCPSLSLSCYPALDHAGDAPRASLLGVGVGRNPIHLGAALANGAHGLPLTGAAQSDRHSARRCGTQPIERPGHCPLLPGAPSASAENPQIGARKCQADFLAATEHQTRGASPLATWPCYSIKRYKTCWFICLRVRV